MADPCLQPGDRIGGPYELSKRLGAPRAVQRNIEPSNTLGDEAGQVRLLDFGVARRPELYELQTGRLSYRNAIALTCDPSNSPVGGANR